jgi:hypothetical protein
MKDSNKAVMNDISRSKALMRGFRYFITLFENIIAENIFQFILYSYFTSHKTIISEISRILNPAFFNSKESKFKFNVLKTNKTDEIRNFDIYEI